MKILSIELTGFKRMQLNQVVSFKMIMEESIQLILGTNGSGKSSLIAELTPLPGDPAHYFKEGSKTIRITHHGSSYVLISIFAGGQKHEFWKDGENLNEGRTVTVQKELVRQEFGITPEVHDLLTGRLRFCDMAPIRRREWFTKLADTNYDYALGVFQKLKDRLRDTSGAAKLAKRRLVAEQAKVISAAEEEKLTRETHEISRELELLQSQRAPVERASQDYRSEIEHGLHELARLSQRLLRMNFAAPTLYTTQVDEDGVTHTTARRFASLEAVTAAIDEYRQTMAVTQELINKAVAEHKKIEDTVAVLQRTGAEGVASLRQRQASLLVQGSALLETRRLKLNMQPYNSHLALQVLDSLSEQLQAIFAELPSNEDKRFSQQRQQEVQQQLLQLKDARGARTVQLLQLGGKRQHMQAHKNADQVQCPACMHRWHLGYSDDEAQRLDEQMATHEVEIKKLDEQVADLEVTAAQIQEYGELYRSYVRLTQSAPLLRPLWDYVTEQGYVWRSPKMVPQLLEHHRFDLQQEIAAAEIDQQLADIDQLIRDAEKVGNASLAEQSSKLEEVSFHIEELTARLNRAQEHLSECNAYCQRISEGQELAAKIAQLQTDLSSANAQMVEMLRRETLNGVIRTLQHLLVRKEETLAAVTLQKGIIADLQTNIAQLELQEEAARLCVQALSPTEGLIAEGLLGFIRSFVAEMNSLIRKIWSYPLVIKDCGQTDSDGAELDYKFPMMVQSKDNVVRDVNEGSTGMQEIVNLAFKVTAMKYLGLAEAPLYLDEFGASFDKAHRFQATAVIKSLMDQRPFTQLFLVSHYEASYGALTNAQICVLCPTNITVPLEHKYNQHVVIT